MITEDEALNRMASYCAASEHCRWEVSEKLLRLGFPHETIEQIVDRLVQERYIDEARFCRAYVNDKYRFARWGKQKIRQGLYLKHIPESIVEECIAQIDEEAYLEMMTEVIAAKRRTVKGKNEYDRNGKLIRFALGRGFEMKDILKVVKQNDDENMF